MISKLKILVAIIVIIGVIVGYLDFKYSAHGLLLESSPDRPSWLPEWLGLVLTSAASIIYIVLDYLQWRHESKYKAFQ